MTGRREPPAFRRVVVESVEPRGLRLTRVVFEGDELAGFTTDHPAASVRLLLPDPGCSLEIPKWNGNEFLLADGRRPLLRTFTPWILSPRKIAIDIVIHEGGATSQWARSAHPGDTVAVSGPGRGHRVNPDAIAFVLGGDETAVPAISQLMQAMSSEVDLSVHIVAPADFGRVDLPKRQRSTVTWHELSQDRGEALADAFRSEERLSDSHIWCAGEAAAMQRIRKLLFDELGVSRSRATVRGYWKA